MHHLILLLPILALGLFFIFKWQIALIIYIPILLSSIVVFFKILQAQRQPRTTGEDAMIGDRAVVIEVQTGETLVDYQGEIWRAVSTQPLHPHEEVLIEAVNGLLLTVVPCASPSGKKDPP